jgi:hypothetical protein
MRHCTTATSLSRDIRTRMFVTPAAREHNTDREDTDAS